MIHYVQTHTVRMHTEATVRKSGATEHSRGNGTINTVIARCGAAHVALLVPGQATAYDVVHQFLNSTMWTESHCRQPRSYLWRHKQYHGNGTISENEYVTSHLWRYWLRTPAVESVCNALVTETIIKGVLSCDTICGAT